MDSDLAVPSGVALIGLTGGIASGKSSVAARFAQLGAVVIDADLLSRDVVAPGTPGHTAVVEAFGPAAVGSDGSLNRKHLAELVFTDDVARGRLSGIVHPLVRQRARDLIAATPTGTVIVHDVPLLLENQMAADYHVVITVLADERRRIERLRHRGLTERQARARLATQVDDELRRRVADVVIDNDGSLDDTYRTVDAVWHDRLVGLRDNLVAGKVPASVEPAAALGEYDTQWPLRYQRLQPRVAAALGDRVLSLHHVGATAVPGMSGPGVIDIRAWLHVGSGGSSDDGAVGLAAITDQLARRGWFPLATAWRVPRFGFADPANPARLYVHGGADQ